MVCEAAQVITLARFDQLAAEAGVELALAGLLPRIAAAGQPAGELTEAGAKLLDPTGRLRPGIPNSFASFTNAPRY